MSARRATAGAGGPLLPSQFVLAGLREGFTGRLGEQGRGLAALRFQRWWHRVERTIGPATSVRTIVETCAAPLFGLLGFRFAVIDIAAARALACATAGAATWPVLIMPWAEDLDRGWREAVRAGRVAGARWTFALNAQELRLVDAQRPWGRKHLSFDLARCAADAEAFGLVWGLARADALRPRASIRPEKPAARGRRLSLLDEVVEAASRSEERVCRGLESGVHSAVTNLATALVRFTRREHGVAEPETLFELSLIAVYRLLFLLFAEARLLVPTWHATYREAYSVHALCEAASRSSGPEVGLWAAIQAIARLAHRGCRVGALKVTAFNGHLFSPKRAALLERVTIRDEVLAEVLRSLSTTAVGKRVVRIAFADLGVEQLGAIYERILDHRLEVRSANVPGAQLPTRVGARAELVPGQGVRKSSATFYTPRALCDLIVRRTLAPLVRNRSSSELLQLRILDPAMGSGAFLVAACIYLARAYEAATLREQQLRDHELTESDRAEFRRVVARRCIYGVDRNPMAVQLAQLSLWLATLAADVPLAFLDHHVRVGDSLVGATLQDLLRQSPGPHRGSRDLAQFPLLRAGDALDAIDAAIPDCHRLTEAPDDSLEQVRAKERLLASLRARGAPLTRWRDAADLWCSASFWRDDSTPPVGAVYRELLAAVLERRSSLPAQQTARQVELVRLTAARERFFHWPFEFPEVFSSHDTVPGGFDAVLGNPPWDMVRDDASGTLEPGRAQQLSSFVRHSGIYTRASKAHVNLYLLFIERACQLLRPGGRLGLVVPWGLASDQGAADVRRSVMNDCELDTFIAVDNRRALFPVHRSLRFLVLTATRGQPTRAIRLTRIPGEAAALDAFPESGNEGAPTLVTITRDLLSLTTGATMSVPDVRSQDEVALLERLWRSAPALAAPGGWAVTFGRELNATDDRHMLREAPPGLRVLEGKHIDPFVVRLTDARRYANEAAVRSKLGTWPLGPRVAYRDVASATNGLTLIAAVVPAGAVTTHTLFCCRTPLEAVAQGVLCALLNSLVANWIVRRWVSSHVTVALVERVPMPTMVTLGRWADDLHTCAVALAANPPARERRSHEARVHAIAARAWTLNAQELEIVLRDFPLLDRVLLDEVRREFARIPDQRA